MRRILGLISIGALTIGLVAAGPPAEAGPPPPLDVMNEAQYRDAVAHLAGLGTCDPDPAEHTITLLADITLTDVGTGASYVGGTCPLTVDGGGFTLSGDDGKRVLFADAGPTVEFEKLTLTDITITEGAASDEGGAVKWEGPVDLVDVVADNNYTLAAGDNSGGFLSAGGDVTATDSVFTNNSSTAASSGDARGGAIHLDDLGDTLTLDGVVASGNTVTAPDNAIGGAFYVQGPADVDHSVLNGNGAEGGFAGGGGALHARDTITVDDSSFSGNGVVGTTQTANGGAIQAPGTIGNHIVTINDTTLIGNSGTGANPSSNGSAVSIGSGFIYANNVTVTGNRMLGTAGGAALAGQNVFLQHATVTSNDSPDGASNISATSEIRADASVVADPLGEGFNCNKAAGPSNHVWTDTDECQFAGNGIIEDVDGDPGLGPLRNNGGVVDSVTEAGEPPFTHQTMFPLAGSPLIDAIPTAACLTDARVDLDQREVDRPFGDGCDIGAIEAVFPAHGFSDVSKFYDGAVRWTTSPFNTPQLQLGFGNGTFRTQIDITRGQAVYLLFNEAGAPEGPPGGGTYPDNGFSDVISFFDPAVDWAKAEGVFLGYDDNTFKPDRPITRGQLTRAKWGFAGQPAGPPEGGTYPDSGFPDVINFFKPAVDWAKANALVNGFPNGKYKTNANILRGDATRIDYELARTPDAWDDPDMAPPNMLFRPNDEDM